ncbi:MAG: MFS transporter, partial [Solirubrobacterales bacterium]|nr:MFS transporter [Solirubrobacterales bacterium]
MNVAPTSAANPRRWTALFVVCLAQLMIVLDVTIVNVALPSIQHELHFSQGNLTWVVNAFLVSFGSLLLLAGRLGDLAGRKRVFLAGLVVFTIASVICGLAPSQGVLIGARFLQGIGAAMQASVILAIIITEFPEAAERARAMSVYVFVSVAGGSLGLLAGGILTQTLSWHWVFFVNLPIGLAALGFGHWLIPSDSGLGLDHGVDWLGSVLVTTSLMSAIYAIVQATAHGWLSSPVLGFGVLAAGLMTGFLVLEARIQNPIMPLRILRLRGLVNASLIRGFLVTGMYSTFFLATLYLEHVRHYSALQTGAAFLPWTLTVAVLSQGVTAWMVNRFGALRVLMGGMASAVIGLLLFSSVGPDTSFFPTVFLACFAIGLGIGSAFMPLLTIAMADVPSADAGLGSGITNVSQQISGALGLAVLSTIAANHTKSLLTAHHGLTSSLIGGYHVAFLAGATTIAVGVLLAYALLRPGRDQSGVRLARAPASGPETDTLTTP